ncbi:MAG: UDP-N-acetylmuramoyl-L-alanine--D-glutamate ligase [Ruminococcaceae bacterium]|nr:UDP-N-acetylmuramoyl-L-alanine--D-glutamate ligase [Oscillospiraceae bacterium]
MSRPVYNPKFELFKKAIIGKKVGVLGVGVSNLPVIELLNNLGAIVYAFDKKEEKDFDEKALEILHSNTKGGCVLGKGYLDNLNDVDIIIKTPGIRPDIPELVKAEENDVVVTSEMEIFLSICPCKIIGVTGSDGKTTTTTLIYEILKANGYNCHVGGNIGKPLLPVIEFIDPNDIAVLELSSFQLQTMQTSPEISVVTNVAPNHLDYHKDMDEYTNAKKNIFLNQNHTGKLIINSENAITNSFEDDAVGEVAKFSLHNRVSHGTHIYRGKIYYDDEMVLNVKDIILPGEHNVDNYLAAICATYPLVDTSSIVKVAKTFGGVAHRLEFVREYKGVKFYNDSIASSPTRTTAGLKSFDDKVILIAGGYDKKIPFDGFGKIILEKTKGVMLIGDTSNKIRCEIEQESEKQGKTIPLVGCNTLEEAVKSAFALAKDNDVVLLSPACASFDMFKNFEERGNAFKQIVALLGQEE